MDVVTELNEGGSTAEKVNLIGMDMPTLKHWVVSLGEKPFRAVQLTKWIHQKGVSDFDQMTDMSQAFRRQLNAMAEIYMPPVVKEQISADGTTKWLMQVGDNNFIETVYIPEAKRGTLCISSQVGCALDCSFCATAKQGFNRNLTASEIVAQMRMAYLALGIPEKSTERRITNVVFMGMGEPLLNTKHVIPACRILMEDNAYGLSKNRVTVSTAGVVPAFDPLKQAVDVSLAVSLHAATDDLRDEIVPVNQKYPLAQLMGACQAFAQDYHHRHITFEYVMIDQVNDQIQHAKALIRLVQGVPAKINLIPFNPFPGSHYRQSTAEAIEAFKQRLQRSGINATVRKTRGEDIDAACGQLAGDIQDRTKRQQHLQNVTYYTPVHDIGTNETAYE